MSPLSEMFFDFSEGIFSVEDDDPFNGFGRPYHDNGLVSDDEYRDYIQAHNANSMVGAFNYRTSMFDDGSDPFGIYDDDDWAPGLIGFVENDKF